MNLFTILSFLSAAIYLCLGLYAWRKEPGLRLTKIFFLQCLSLAAWAFFYAPVFQAPNKETLWFWYKMSSLGWCTIGGITLHFFMLLCGKERLLKKPWIYIFLYLPGLILVYQAWTGIVVTKDFIPGALGWIEVPAPDSFWYWFHVSNLLICVMIGLYLFWQRGKTSSLTREKAQTHLILTSAGSVLVIGFTINMILPIFEITIFPAIAPIILLLWAIAVWRSMVKYRLMALSPKIAIEEIVARMQDLMLMINTSGEILQINPQAEKLLGYRENELLGKGLETIIPDSELVVTIREATKNGIIDLPDREMAMKTRTGGTLPVFVSASILRDDFKDPIGLVLVGHDLRQTKALQEEIAVREEIERELIKGREFLKEKVVERNRDLTEANKKLEAEINERKLSEEFLRRSEERYRNILSSIEDGYFEVDLAGTMILCNKAEARMFGYTPEELIGMNYREYTDPENAKIVFEIYNVVYRTGVPHKGFEYEVVNRNGAKVSVETSVSLILDSNHQKIGFRGILRDITRQKQAEAALRQSEERYRSILASIEDGYFEVDLAGNMIFCNDAQCRIIGYPMNEVIGMNNRRYMDEESANKVYETFNRVYRTGLPEKGFDWELTRKDGSKIHVETSVSLILDLDQQKLGFRGILRDVARQKQAEEALKAMSLVDDLTGIYNRRGFLTLAEQELKIANRMGRGTFLLFADLDDLKGINDNFGHLEGDQALKDIARILKETFRDPDILARIGGDEFVILAIEGASEAGPELLLERLRKNIELSNKESSRPYMLSLSMGVAGYEPEHSVSIETLLIQADRNMYEEKQGKKKNTQLRIEF